MILNIETSTERGVVLLAEAGRVVRVEFLPIGVRSSRHLMPAIKKVLGSECPDAIAVGIGPGYFTGIRVGVAAAQGLARGFKVPLIPFSGLHAFSSPAYIAVIDARMEGVYWLEPGGDPRHSQLTDFTPSLPLRGPSFARLPLEGEEVAPDPNRLASLTWELFQEGHLSLDGAVDLLYLRETVA